MKWRSAVGIIVLAALVFWGWTILFPSDEQVIRQRLSKIAELASFNPGEKLWTKTANLERLISYFSPAAEIILDPRIAGLAGAELNGRDELMQAARTVRFSQQGMKIEFLDTTVEVAPGGESAVANLTATVQLSTDRELIVQELKFSLEKRESKWLITRVEAVRPLL